MTLLALGNGVQAQDRTLAEVRAEARALGRQRRFDQALALLAQSKSLLGNLPPLAADRILILCQANRPEEATKEFEAFPAGSEPGVDVLLAMAPRYAERGQFEKSLALMQDAVRLSRGARWVGSSCALQILAMEKSGAWRFDPATHPPPFTLALAGACREMGRLQKAAVLYRAIPDGHGESRAATSGLILTLARLAKSPRALLDDVELNLFRKPDDAGLRIVKAELLHRLGRNDGAWELCEQVLAAHPGHFDARTLKARLLIDQAGRGGDGGLAKAEQAVALAELAPEILVEYVKALVAAGRMEEALVQLDEVPDLYEVSPDLLKAAARACQVLQRGGAAVALGSAALRKPTGDSKEAPLKASDLKEMLQVEGEKLE